MSSQVKTHESGKASTVRRAPERADRSVHELAPQAQIGRASAHALTATPQTLSPTDILSLQQSVGNRATQKLLGAMLGQPDSLSSSTRLNQPRTPPTQPSTAANAIQRKTEEERLRERSSTAREKEHRTGLLDSIKAGIENLSGFSMDDVNVHYNSPRPAGVQALAYTQGTNIYIAPDEEKHLPHEAWHVVQQKQGRVKPTLRAKGLAINDDQALEQEADVMGRKL